MTRISVIIPTLGEAEALPTLLKALFDQGFDDVIVADASSDLATIDAARGTKARCLPNLKRGRGAQMHEGALAAEGDVLFFLHADSVLPPNAFQAIAACMAKSGIVAGSFRLAFNSQHPLLSLYALCSWLNWRVTTYGDQGLFVHRSTYQNVGGFRPIALLEDFEIQSRLRRVGRFEKLPFAIVTSARRFEQRGILKQQVLNLLIVLAYLVGVSPERLASCYYRPPSL